MIEIAIKTYWESTIQNGISFLTEQGDKKIKKVKNLIHLFYFVVLLTSIKTFSAFYQFPEWNIIMESKHLFEPIWSVKWISIDRWEIYIRSIFLSFLIFSFIGIILWERSRFIRTGVFVSMLFYVSVISSFGKIDHYMHLMVIVTFLLIFIPNKKSNNKSEKQTYDSFFMVFFGIQTLILLTYFTSGIFKFYGILDQELSGLKSALSPDSLAQNLGKTSFASNSDYFLSTFVLNNSSYFFSIVLIIGYLIEVLSIYIIFKPNLHKTWGLLLIILHTGILLSVGPDFTQQILVVGIFLLFSPFCETDIITDLSVKWKAIHKRFRYRKKKNNFTVFYDTDCLVCNRFLQFISKYELPNEISICKLQSVQFEELIKQKKGLASVDSIIVLEVDEDDHTFVRVKADGIVWVLSKIKSKFILLRFVYKVFPFFGNYTYDLIAKNRKNIDL
jgi:predicted DCC family thiol-disulfide oxidoreductase YuxK